MTHERQIAILLVATGLATSLLFGALSPQGILHFDDLTHYLYAKWVWQWPAYLLNDWGRPGFTALYFLPAKFGWQACRALSAVLTASSAWLSFCIARRMGLRRAWAVVLLCYAQPLFFQLSQTTLTETALAFYVTVAVYLAQRGRWSWSAAFVSIGFVTRHEAIVFLPVWMWFAWRQGVKPWRLWPIFWAPLVVNLAAPLVGLKAAIWLLFEPQSSGQYGRGGWLTFFSRSMKAWGPGVMVLAMTGIVATWKMRRGGALVGGCVVVYFCTQTAVRALGLFNSGGYARFLVGVSPLVAIAALVGWQRLWSADVGSRRAAVMAAAGSMILLWIAMERQLVLYAARLDEAAALPELYPATIAVRTATVAIVVLAGVSVAGASARGVLRHTTLLVPAGLAAMILLASYGLCHPLWESQEARIVEDLSQRLRENGLAGREIITAHVWVDYATGQALPPDRPTVRRRLEQAPLGTLFAWEEEFAASPEHDLPLEEFSNSPAFRQVVASRPAPRESEPYIRVFEKTGPWKRSRQDSSDLPAPKYKEE